MRQISLTARFSKDLSVTSTNISAALQGAKKDILGIVLNCLSPRKIEYYSNYRYYRSYKKYYGAEA